MNRNFSLRLASLLALSMLASCGGGSSTSTPQQAGQTNFGTAEMAGYWSGAASAESYEFYNTPDTAPYTSLKTGRIFQGGEMRGLFWWTKGADGSLTINKAAPSCAARPIDQCPVTATVQATMGSGGAWKLDFDDNHDGKIDRTVNDTFSHASLNLADLPEGEFLLPHGELFDSPLQGYRHGKEFGIRMQLLDQPLAVTADVPGGAVASLEMNAGGEANAVRGNYSFLLKSGQRKTLSVKQWLEKVVLQAGAGKGLVLHYEVHRKVLFPNDVDPATVVLDNYETPNARAIGLGRIDHFVHGPTIAAGDKFATFLPVDFDPAVVLLGAGNEIEFTSATQGVLRHVDFNQGKYSEHRPFTWKQQTDGSVILAYPSGLALTMRFIKEVTGGYNVVYTIPHPTMGTAYLIHDLIRSGPPILSETDIPGRYSFISSDGVTQNELVLHKDKTVSGVVGGFWFRDSNGDFVGFECRDLANKPITSYELCYAQLNDTSKVNFVHVRRLRFLAKQGQEIALKYDGAVYGDEFGVLNRDYLTVALTYRFKRVGDE